MKDSVLDILEEFVTFFEGKRYTAYLDSNGIPTIGIGSTKNVQMGMTITEDEVRRRFADDLHDADIRVITMVHVPLTDNKYAVMVDIGFNMSYHSSVNLSGYINTDEEVFKKKLLLYSNDATGHLVKGLMIRRTAERLLFESRDWKEFAAWGQSKTTTVQMIQDRQKELFPTV